MIYVDFFVAAKAFNWLNNTEDALETSVLQNSVDSCSTSSMADKENRDPCIKNEVLQLLSLYKIYNHLFKSLLSKTIKYGP